MDMDNIYLDTQINERRTFNDFFLMRSMTYAFNDMFVTIKLKKSRNKYILLLKSNFAPHILLLNAAIYFWGKIIFQPQRRLI